ncbi:MAG: hypothetical protein MJ084_02240 [Saccharofermentans sp.]|nr:hypothetical protein [Saccharofermentans sp.]
MNIKKITATVLVSALSLSVTACFQGGSHDGTRGSGVGFHHTNETTETREPLHRAPSHDLTRVDATEDFGTIEIDKVTRPWGKDMDVKMAGQSVRTYFVQYCLDANDNQVCENLNNISTINKPIITSYPAEEDGYVIYEVNYTQIFPISYRVLGNYNMSFFSYHNVSFLDYYTGLTYPSINMSMYIDSFSVTGNVVYDGETYRVGYYEFRSTTWDEGEEESPDGVINQKVKITSTSYFVVPEGYDGIIMYVYTADDTAKPVSEVLADNTPYLSEAAQFGDDENPDDYEFFLITAPH